MDQNEIEFAEQHDLEGMAEAIRSDKDYSFVIKKAIEECGSAERFLFLIFRSKISSLAYFSVKYADLTLKQISEVVLFLINQEDSLRLLSLIKEDLISGGPIDLVIEYIVRKEDYDAIYSIAIYANHRKIDQGQKNVLVNAMQNDDDMSRREEFAENVRWLNTKQRRQIRNK